LEVILRTTNTNKLQLQTTFSFKNANLTDFRQNCIVICRSMISLYPKHKLQQTCNLQISICHISISFTKRNSLQHSYLLLSSKCLVYDVDLQLKVIFKFCSWRYKRANNLYKGFAASTDSGIVQQSRFRKTDKKTKI